jgi:hypothetical protein
MIIQFVTVSGSAYEVDQENRRCRRLKDPTRDGQWRIYKQMTPIVVGSTVLFMWELFSEDKQLLSADELLVAAPATWTTAVKEILFSMKAGKE